MKSDFIAKNGLMRLTPEKDAEDSDNDNGILFLVYYMYLCKYSAWDVYVEEFKKIVKLLEVVPGLHMRNPGRHDNASSHDNTLGIVAGAVLFNHKSLIEEIIKYGQKNGFTYDARYPNKTDYFRWRQGSDVAFYKLCADYMPALWELLWLYLAQIYSWFIPKENSSSHLTNWLRFKALKITGLRTERKDIKIALSISGLFEMGFSFFVRHKTDGFGMQRMFEKYFTHPEHPIRLKSEGVKF